MNVDKVIFDSPLEVRALDGDVFQLTKNFYVTLTLDGQLHGCEIPLGFTTDFCSVPRVPLAYTLFGGKYSRSGTLHDALYSGWHEVHIYNKHTREIVKITRELADDILFAALRAEGAFWITARAMYRGVRIFGGAFFKRKV